MKWIKKGLIYTVNKNYEWMQTHAQVPTIDKISENKLRIYFGTRDKLNRTSTTYIEVDADNPKKVFYIHNKPILPFGRLGCFDDNGVMPNWLINNKGKKYYYYLGWNTSTTVRYRVAIGLAISEDGGNSFKRYSEAPIMDRSIEDPLSVSTNCILIENNIWKMWYMSFTKWEEFNGILEPLYHIKYAESKDGINWLRKNIICIDFKSINESAIARPCVIKDNEMYRMWYSFRFKGDYRRDKRYSYRIGYAESNDGINWTRKDNDVGIDVSNEGWDSEMIAYAQIYSYKGQKFMLYNGNGFGKTGFGYALLNEN